MLSQATAPPAREQQRAGTRLRLLDAALDEFLAHGFAGASTRRVTSAAGVSHGLLFHHYASKAELYAALVRLGAAEVEVDLEGALQDPLGFFEDRAERVLTMLRERPSAARMVVFMDAAHSRPGLVPEARPLLAQTDLVRACVPVVEAGQRVGAIRPGSPSALSLVFWAALHGVARERFHDPEAELPDPRWVLDLLRGGGWA